MRHALTIAGSDSSGGAGIQADIKTFAAHGIFGMSVITAVTAQNTRGVTAVEDISPETVAAQIKAIYDDIRVDAVKIGMVSAIPTIEAIYGELVKYGEKRIVLDPVMISKSGSHLLRPDAVAALSRLLLPQSLVVTPNIPEAETLTGMRIDNMHDMEEAARALHGMGPAYVLIKGGHSTGDAEDLLFDGLKMSVLPQRRIGTANTHGTGCTLSSAIAANIAAGADVGLAVRKAKEYITMAITHSFSIGAGPGPTDHFFALYEKAGLKREI